MISRIAGPSRAALPSGFALHSPTTTSRSLGASVSVSASTLPAGFCYARVSVILLIVDLFFCCSFSFSAIGD